MKRLKSAVRSEVSKLATMPHTAAPKFLAFAIAVAASLAASQAHAAGSASAAEVALENDTSLSNGLLMKHVFANVDAGVRNRLRSGHYALHVRSARTGLRNGSNYCLASVGATHVAPDGLRARAPSVTQHNAFRAEYGVLDAEQQLDCETRAIDDALRAWSRAGNAFEDIQVTKDAGSVRPNEPPDATRAHVTFHGGAVRISDAVFDAIGPSFRSSFDYRQVQWVVNASAFEFDGRVVCHADAGLAARAPANRQPRLPPAWTNSFIEMSPQESASPRAREVCQEQAAVRAVRARLAEPWNGDGLLAGFDRTREDGVSLPVSRLDAHESARPPMDSGLRTNPADSALARRLDCDRLGMRQVDLGNGQWGLQPARGCW